MSGESGEFLEAEEPDIAAETPNLEGEIDTLVHDDIDTPVSEPSDVENEDLHDEQKELNNLTEGCRDLECDELGESLKQSRKDGAFARALS